MKQLRDDFPILKKPLIYFDSAATSQKPQVVLDGMHRFYSEEYGTVHRAVYDLATGATELYNNVRKQVQAFLHAASADEIIFTKGTTESINLVARCFPLQAGDEIIISEMEHHSNIVPWQMTCKERGAVLKIIPMTDKGELDLEAYKKLLNPRTKLVSVAHISNSTGTVNPIRHIIELAHQHKAKVFIDGAQAAAHIPVDVQKLDADFYAFSGHKVFGPTGIGILYGKKELLEEMPPYQGGGDMIETVTMNHTIYQPAPLKFEAGTPLIAQVIGLGAALTYIESIGLSKIAAWEKDLLIYATDKLKAVKGLKIIGTAKEKGAIISFVIDGIHHLDIGTLLNLKGIAVRTGHHCAQPAMERFGISGTTRISFAPYNTRAEIDTFVDALRDIVKQLS